MEELEKILTFVFVKRWKEGRWWEAIAITFGVWFLFMLVVGLARALRLLLQIAPQIWHVVAKIPRPSGDILGLAILAAISTLAVFLDLAKVLGLAEIPHSFYMLLRVLVCLTSAVGFSCARRQRLKFWQWVFGTIGVLFNPILPVRLGDRDVWLVLNFLAMVFWWAGTYRMAERDFRSSNHAQRTL